MEVKRTFSLVAALRSMPSWLFLLMLAFVYAGFRQLIAFTGLPNSTQSLLTWSLILFVPLRPRFDVYSGVLLISVSNIAFIIANASPNMPNWNGLASVSLTCTALIGISEVLYRTLEQLHDLNEELRRALAKSDDAAIAKSKFLAVITHEIRTPLSGIVGLTDMLLREEDRPAKQQTLKQLQSAADSLSHLLNTTLEFAKLDAGKTKSEPEATSLCDYIEQLSHPLKSVAVKKGLHFASEVDKHINLPVDIDQTLLKQVLNNLVTNAIKFTPAGEVRITVDLHRQFASYQDIRFAVSDTGIGIPDHAQRRLFAPFEQVQDQYQRASEGTGLGLAICKEIVQLLGGEIELQSTPGEGSVFEFTLRCSISSSKKPQKDSPPELAIPQATGKVLVAEDNPINQTYIVKLLEKAGLTTVCAANGLRAVEAAEKEQFDLILMDLQMPVMSGLEATKQIRQLGSYQNIPIVALTACSADQERDQALQNGFDDFYSKPLRVTELINLCNKLSDQQDELSIQQIS